MASRLRATGLGHGRCQRAGPGLIRPRFVAPLPAGELGETAHFPVSFFERPVTEVARDILGACLISDTDGLRTAGVIVETEAYGGPEDPASHASAASGVSIPAMTFMR